MKLDRARRIVEDVDLVAALRRELGHDRALLARLEPVEGVREDRELLARPEDDLALALDVEVDDAGPAAESLLLAGRALERRVAVLGADLAGKEHELLRADALRVQVDDELQADL